MVFIYMYCNEVVVQLYIYIYNILGPKRIHATLCSLLRHPSCTSEGRLGIKSEQTTAHVYTCNS